MYLLMLLHLHVQLRVVQKQSDTADICTNNGFQSNGAKFRNDAFCMTGKTPMIQLYRFELGKLVRRASFAAGVLLFVTFAIMTYAEWVDLTGRKLYLIDEDGTLLHGREALKLEQELADRYGGVLTDDSLKEIELLAVWNEQQRETFEQYGGQIRYPYIYYLIGYYFLNVNSITVRTGSSELRGVTSIELSDDGAIPLRPIADVFPDSVLPLRLAYSLPWSGMMESMILNLFGLGLLILFIIAPAFSEERMHKMNALLFTSKLGKMKCFLVKSAAAYSLGIVFAVAVILLHALVTFAFFGGDGLSGSIQIANLYSEYQELPYVKTVGGAILDAAVFYTADVMFAVSISLLGSVLAPNLLMGIVLSAVLWAAPAAVIFLKAVSEQVRLLAPAVHLTGFSNVLSMPKVTIFSVTIPYSYAAAGILLLLSGLILMFAAASYRRVTGE